LIDGDKREGRVGEGGSDVDTCSNTCGRETRGGGGYRFKHVWRGNMNKRRRRRRRRKRSKRSRRRHGWTIGRCCNQSCGG
jgi:hypothetical protein